MAEADFPRYVLLTDAPPLKEGGHGCHVLAWNWIQAVGSNVRLVVTHRLNRTLELQRIAADLANPVKFYPDLSRVRWPGRLAPLKSFCEVCLFVLWLPKFKRAVRMSGADRIFAFFGGNPWFLLVAQLAATATRLPLDIYLVDDLEESARLNGNRMVARLTRWCEPRVLRRTARVFAISPGYTEHLGAKYGITAEWLPIVISAGPINHHPFQPSQPDVRAVTFIGAVNPLYEQALRDFLHAIEEWNTDSKSPFQLRLRLLTYSEQAYLEAALGPSRNLEVFRRPSPEEFQREMRESWALFLPYSFAPEVRTMVSTSFPTKLSDSLPVGRPIFVYGPAHASVPRYFADRGLPLMVTRHEDLITVLREVERHDNLALMQQYEATIARVHSPEAIRARLTLSTGSEGKRG